MTFAYCATGTNSDNCTAISRLPLLSTVAVPRCFGALRDLSRRLSIFDPRCTRAASAYESLPSLVSPMLTLPYGLPVVLCRASAA